MSRPAPPLPPFLVIDRLRAGPVADMPRGSALAIGNFDGVHRGHQALLATVKADASRRRTAAGVMIFDPHPREFFQPFQRGADAKSNQVPHFRLTTRAQKLRLFQHFGLDLAVVLRWRRSAQRHSLLTFWSVR